MKKRTVILVLTMLLALSACEKGEAEGLERGNGDLREQIAALETENAALQEHVAALEEENDRLSLENDLLGQDLAAAQDALEQPEAQQVENPIDPFYDGLDTDGTTAAMSAAAWGRSNAWEAEARNLAEQLKAQLPLQEDRELADAYIAAVEEQLERMDVMSVYTVSDTEIPQADRMNSTGTLAQVLRPAARAQMWKDTFYQLRWVLPGDQSYDFIFDPEAARLELADVLRLP